MNQTEKMIIKFLKNTFIFLPLIYFAGALLDSCDVFLRDFIYGLPFLLVGIYFLIKENVGLLLLSSAYLFHVVFDLLYFFFIEDSYMIPFYEIICIFYDFFAGLYLLKKRSLSWWFYKPPCWLYSTVTDSVLTENKSFPLLPLTSLLLFFWPFPACPWCVLPTDIPTSFAILLIGTVFVLGEVLVLITLLVESKTS